MKIEVFGREMTESTWEEMTHYTVAVETAEVCVFMAGGGKWGATWSSGTTTVASENKDTPRAAARSLELIMQGTVPLMVSMVHKIKSFPRVGDHSVLSVLAHMNVCPEALMFVGHTKLRTFEELYEACTLPRWFSRLCWGLKDPETHRLKEEGHTAASSAFFGSTNKDGLDLANAAELAFYQRPESMEVIKAAMIRYANKHTKELT